MGTGFIGSTLSSILRIEANVKMVNTQLFYTVPAQIDCHEGQIHRQQAVSSIKTPATIVAMK